MCHLIGVLTAEGDKTVKNKLMQSVYEVGILSKCVVDKKTLLFCLKFTELCLRLSKVPGSISCNTVMFMCTFYFYIIMTCSIIEMS